jgi:autotransporter-associated beta strand protein
MVGDTWIGNNGALQFYYAGQVSGPYSLIKVGNNSLVNQGSFANDVKALIVSNGMFKSIQLMGQADISVYSNATLSLYTESALSNKLSLFGGALLKNDGSRSPRMYGDVILKDVATIQVFDPAKTMTIYGNISGDGSFKKIDTGKLLLTGTNTFSGSMWVTNGIVQINSTNSLPTTADIYLYTASSNGSTPIAQLNLNYDGVRAVRRFYIDDELQTRNKIYHSANSKLTLTGTGMICPLEGTNPKGMIVRFY